MQPPWSWAQINLASYLAPPQWLLLDCSAQLRLRAHYVCVSVFSAAAKRGILVCCHTRAEHLAQAWPAQGSRGRTCITRQQRIVALPCDADKRYSLCHTLLAAHWQGFALACAASSWLVHSLVHQVVLRFNQRLCQPDRLSGVSGLSHYQLHNHLDHVDPGSQPQAHTFDNIRVILFMLWSALHSADCRQLHCAAPLSSQMQHRAEATARPGQHKAIAAAAAACMH